ncbi:ribonuclease domain-containing protein [Butyrivibrio sp. VCB2006]|uniref:ribonuclease domain-containing protein n=1 Tax=Butyrivibrio sp. VCB2006 TaxID=1280679 RepID=UPI00041B1F6D|nr:ribonuclease domain-containing protein [Butyrivibrio sp. VCB2006]
MLKFLRKFKITTIWLALVLAFCLTGCTSEKAVIAATERTSEEVVIAATESTSEEAVIAATESTSEEAAVAATTEAANIPDENGEYTSREDVALYIHTYGKLPSNFITKKAAKKLGWPGGSLEEYAPGKSIGGDYFGNYEGLLPKKKGREYHECDIDTKGKSKRGSKRIIYSNDGLIYYTGDHYESFELLYGEP